MATFTRHRSRLAAVREHKAKAQLEMLGELTNDAVAEPSDVVVAGNEH